ncbi:hypothetical protein DTL21_22275 [Bremerella cremea]|uniref:Uncharacterized protein n=1 Tax=Blastopirellula marina TaxID=124 RepID=A0A2S8FFJ4_9BACT|nr:MULTISPECIES: hypothetical protein [Pirellulaceae]PQO30926.1 hypothetical protein C5Y83_22240 [Blastopirellula marina]RCS44073.1 hypothetical protein DTL21_22275 [Bremerella cremea]
MTPSEAAELIATWEIIANAEREPEVMLRETNLDEAIVRLNRLILCGVADAFYPLGYAYYCHPQYVVTDSIPNRQCYQALKKSVQLKIEPVLSRLYLAYDRFDHQVYDEALVWLEHLTTSHFAEDIRTRFCELRLCCQIQRKGIINSLDQIEEFAAYVRSLPGWDPCPRLLLKVLATGLPHENVTLKMERVLELLDAAYPMMSERVFRNLACHTPAK